MGEKGFGMGVARVKQDGKFVKVERESEEMIFGVSFAGYPSHDHANIDRMMNRALAQYLH